MNKYYTELQTEAAALADLDAMLALASWDLEVNMPTGAAPRRAQQMATLAALRHNRLTGKVLPLLHDVIASPGNLDETAMRNVKAMHYSAQKAAKLPEAFVAKLAETCALAQQAWEHARTHSSFATFQPHLEEIIALKKQEADYYGYHHEAYDALLDNYDQGTTTAQLDARFDALQPSLKALLNKVQACPQVDDSFLQQPVTKDAQFNFTLFILKQIGFDFTHGRQDYSTHPFSTSMGMEDVRITTRFKETDVQDMLYSTIHECGHALYEQGLQPAAYGMPAAEACSLSIHESQSRIWENNIARSLQFVTFYFEKFSKLFASELKGKNIQDVFRAVNKVSPSLIRTQADELTYHSHVILRYEIEKGLLRGNIAVKELPAVWSEYMQNYLGVTVPDDTNGVLQDVHWSHGAFGYFPTYSLGSLYAAQLEHAAAKSIPTLYNDIGNGNCASLHNWLKQNIYLHGRLYTSEALCMKATGEPLDTSYFLRYLEQKLAAVYGFSASISTK